MIEETFMPFFGTQPQPSQVVLRVDL